MKDYWKDHFNKKFKSPLYFIFSLLRNEIDKEVSSKTFPFIGVIGNMKI